MNPRYDIYLMVKVAEMYYSNGLKQEEIARELEISRSSISMILTEAKEYGIVEINIRNPLVNNDELSNQFETMFNIPKCIILPTKIQDSNMLTKLVAQRSISVFNEEIHDNLKVGIAWGRTTFEFMDSYKPIEKLTGVTVIPLVGGSNRASNKYQLNETVRIFSEKIKGTPNFIHAPAITSSLQDKNLYMKSTIMQEIVEKWKSLDIAVISVGALSANAITINAGFVDGNKALINEESAGAVGDICARLFDINGNFIKDEYYEKIIGATETDLLNAKKVICIAAGLEKKTALIGALHTGIIDIFVSDEQTAKEVLKAYESLNQSDK